MRSLYAICILVSLVLITSSNVVAQSVGDYRTAGTGQWSVNATWQRYNGSAWAAAPTWPTGSEHITIQSTDSVYIDMEVTILDSLKNEGKLGGTGSLTIGATGVYEHAQNNGSLPMCTWAEGATCYVTGYVTGSKPNNANQNFYNLTWNCPGQTSNVDLGMSGNTIGGDVRVINTGASNRMYLTSPNAVPDPITINGSVYLEGGQFASNGSGSSGTIDVTTHGNIIVTGGIFAVSRGSGPDALWKLHGNFSVTNATLQNSGGNHINTLRFVGNTGHVLTLDNVAYGSGTSYFTMEVETGSNLDFGTNVISSNNTGSFILNTGTAVVTAHAGGLNGNVQCTGERGGGNVFSTEANYAYNGAVAQVTGAFLPGTVNELEILNDAGVTLTNPCVVTSALWLDHGILSTGANLLTANGSVTRGTGYVDGNLEKPFDAAGSKYFEVGTADGYSPVTADVVGGTGSMNVKAVQGAHPQVASSSGTLARYWTLNATGITEANLTFSYLASDVNGTEASYQAGRYTGSTFETHAAVVNTSEHTATVSGVTTFSDWTLGESIALDVASDRTTLIPDKFFVDQNYPNPFNPSTTIRFGLPERSTVSIKVFNLVGQEVATLFNGVRAAGIHMIRFDAGALTSGIYLCRIQAEKSVEVRRMVLLK